MYTERDDLPRVGVAGPSERINAEDHSSTRSRLDDGAESVVRTSEETAIVDDRTGGRSTTDAEGPGRTQRTSDERAGTSGPAGAYYEDGAEPVDERPR